MTEIDNWTIWENINTCRCEMQLGKMTMVNNRTILKSPYCSVSDKYTKMNV